MAETIKSDGGKIFALSLEGMIIGIDMLLTSVALSSMSKDLHASISTVQWFMSGYGIGVACFLIPSGKIADLIGHRRMNVLGFTALWSCFCRNCTQPILTDGNYLQYS